MIGKRLGWSEQSALPREGDNGEHVIKAFTIPPGTWSLRANLRVRWRDNQGSTFGISVTIRLDEDQPVPIAAGVTDHMDIPTGTPGQHQAFPVEFFICCTEPTKVALVLLSHNVGVADILDGDSIRTGDPL